MGARTNQVSKDNPNVIKHEWDSVEDLARYAEPHLADYGMTDGMDHRLFSSFYGDYCPTVGAVYAMARDGWDTYLEETLDVCREAVHTVEADTRLVEYTPVWDVSGAIVDIGEYLAGVPECMIEIPPSPTTRYGRIVTVSASTSYSASIHAKTLVERGKVVVALAMELERLGINTELYADLAASGGYSGKRQEARVLIKSANDVLDPAKLLFTYANPGFLRVLALAAMHGMPEDWRQDLNVEHGGGGGHGSPAEPTRDLPEGTIYLPQVLSNRNIPNAADELRKYMRELGLTEETS